MSYTQSELDTMAKLQEIGSRVINMEMPKDVASEKVITEARRYAALELKKLGYSVRTIMKVLGLKSPRSVTYLLAPPTNNLTKKG